MGGNEQDPGGIRLDMYTCDGAIKIEKSDQCYSCEYFLKGPSCPLLEALSTGMVELNGDLTVQNCGLYKKLVRHLKLVGDDDDN